MISETCFPPQICNVKKEELFSRIFCYIGGTSSKRTKCRGVSQINEEKRLLMTENAVTLVSTCRLKGRRYVTVGLLRPLKTDERHLNEKLFIFKKSIVGESVPSPSTLFPSRSVPNKSSQSSCGASLLDLYSGNVSLKEESNRKELKMERLRPWSSCNPNSVEFPSAEGDGRVVSLMSW